MNSTFSRKRTRRAQPSRPEAEDSPGFLMQNVAKSLFLTVLIALGLLLLLSLGLYFSPNPTPLIAPIGIAAACISATVGGMIAAKMHKHSALLCGLLNGCDMSALMLLASLFFRSHASGYPAWLSALLHVAFFACSVFGGYLGSRTATRKKRKRR